MPDKLKITVNVSVLYRKRLKMTFYLVCLPELLSFASATNTGFHYNEYSNIDQPCRQAGRDL
ncbi:MAG: hypothetical protein NTW10_00770 [Bacteroidetes bacterium]|nr:hypothetical protein [Bacteroidota bacterium]